MSGAAPRDALVAMALSAPSLEAARPEPPGPNSVDREADAVTWDGPAFRAGSCDNHKGPGLCRYPQCHRLAFKGVNS